MANQYYLWNRVENKRYRIGKGSQTLGRGNENDIVYLPRGSVTFDETKMIGPYLFEKERIVDRKKLVSRTHCQFDLNGKLTVKDLGSSNGTYVNGEMLDADETRTLVEGDKVWLGMREKLEVVVGPSNYDLFKKKMLEGSKYLATSLGMI